MKQDLYDTTPQHNEEQPITASAHISSRKGREFRVELRHGIVDFLYIIIGVLSATFGLEAFLIPSSFIDGGVTGISLMLQKLTDIPLSVWILVINLPFIILAYSAVGKRFAIKSVIAILLLSLAIQLIHFPVITRDTILVAAFGGLFLGLGIGMAIRGGAIIDGTEVLAIYLSKHTSMSVGNVILIFNILIFLTAAYIFSVEIALYAILTYYAASKTVDLVIDGIEEFMGVTIVSAQSEEIRLAIIERMGRGCTLFNGKKGYRKRGEYLEETDIVYTVITRLEMARLTKEVDKIDPAAFIVMTAVKDTRGGMIKKKPISKIK